MIDYDTMSVHGLERRLIEDHNARTGDFDAIDAALRKAVIREASVATLTVTDKASGPYGSSQIYHWDDIANIVAGTYDLIPRNTGE
jgi:hypothetical protein